MQCIGRPKDPFADVLAAPSPAPPTGKVTGESRTRALLPLLLAWGQRAALSTWCSHLFA